MLRRVIFLCCLILALAACSQPAAPTVGEVTAFGSVCEEANDGERVAVEGYLRLPDSFSGDQSVILWLYETDDFSGPFIGAQTRIGSEANEMEMVPTEYGDEDLEVHLADGQTIGYRSRVKVSGDVYFPIVAQEFECALENLLIEMAG